jgi:hypothetical protein
MKAEDMAIVKFFRSQQNKRILIDRILKLFEDDCRLIPRACSIKSTIEAIRIGTSFGRKRSAGARKREKRRGKKGTLYSNGSGTSTSTKIDPQPKTIQDSTADPKPKQDSAADPIPEQDSTTDPRPQSKRDSAVDPQPQPKQGPVADPQPQPEQDSTEAPAVRSDDSSITAAAAATTDPQDSTEAPAVRSDDSSITAAAAATTDPQDSTLVPTTDGLRYYLDHFTATGNTDPQPQPKQDTTEAPTTVGLPHDSTVRSDGTSYN